MDGTANRIVIPVIVAALVGGVIGWFLGRGGGDGGGEAAPKFRRVRIQNSLPDPIPEITVHKAAPPNGLLLTVTNVSQAQTALGIPFFVVPTGTTKLWVRLKTEVASGMNPDKCAVTTVLNATNGKTFEELDFVVSGTLSAPIVTETAFEASNEDDPSTYVPPNTRTSPLAPGTCP